MQHLEEGTIHAWLDGALSADESAQIEQHARECAECAAMVADARGLIAGAARIVSALDVVPGGVIPKKPASPASRPLWRALRLSPFRAALAASLMIAVASMFAVRAPRGEKTESILVEKAELSKSDSAPVLAAAPAVSDLGASRRAAAPAPQVAAAPTAPSDARRQVEARGDAPRMGTPAEPNAITRRPTEKARAVVDTTLRLADAVAAAAPPAQSQAAQAVVTGGQQAQQGQRQAAEVTQRRERDSLLGKVASAAGAGRGGRAARSADVAMRAPVNNFSALSAPDLAGCYVVADTASWPTGLPLRFALTIDTLAGAAPLHIVKRVDAGGRVDTTTVGQWRVFSALTNVTLNDGTREIVFSLRPSPALTLTPVVGGSGPVRVEHSVCR